MSLSPEERDAIEDAMLDEVSAAIEENLSAPFMSLDGVMDSLSPAIRKALDRALSPDLMPKPGQIVRWGMDDPQGPSVTIAKAGSVLPVPWETVVTAEECLKKLDDVVDPDTGAAAMDLYAGVNHARSIIRRLINEAPRSK